MADIKLAKLPDRAAVKLTFSAPPELHRTLTDYADFYREAYGEAATPADLIPAMLESFMAGDKAFARRQRSRERSET